MHEEPKRSVLKTISWRIIATSMMMLFVYLFTRELSFMAIIGSFDVVVRTVLYFLHERVWNRIEFGRSFVVPLESSIRSPPVAAPCSDNVSGIIQKMINSNIGAVIVTEGGNPAGIITERDILKRVFKTGKDPTKTFAIDIMSLPIATIENNKSVTDAMKIMRDKQIRRLAVTHREKLKGIVTQRRILESLVKKMR